MTRITLSNLIMLPRPGHWHTIGEMRAVAILFLTSCGAPGFGDPMLTRHGSACGSTPDGVVLLGWTIRGAAPTSASCAGIDHLSVDIDGGGCGATIAPVPCALDRWRYDNLPVGSVVATVNALDSGGRVVASGSAQLNLTSAVPSSPAPINLQ
jgi:hypothetical protein